MHEVFSQALALGLHLEYDKCALIYYTYIIYKCVSKFKTLTQCFIKQCSLHRNINTCKTYDNEMRSLPGNNQYIMCLTTDLAQKIVVKFDIIIDMLLLLSENSLRLVTH